MVTTAWMPITKEMFVKVLNMIKEQQEIDDKVGDALETVCGGWVLFNTENKNHQALVMLGIDRLKEWIYLVGLQRLNRNNPAEILCLALFRARFCERISRNSGGGVGSRSNELYLMGLISIVTGSKDDEALSKALDDLPVSDEIKKGITGDGIFSDIFHLACSYENGEWDKVFMYAVSCNINLDVLAIEYTNALTFVRKYGKFGS